MFAANALFLLAAAGLVVLGLFSAPILRGMYALFPSLSAEAAMLLFNALYYLLFMAIPVWLYYRRRPECLPALRLNPLSFRATVVLVLTAFAGVMVVTVLSYFWTLLLEWLGCDTSYAQMTIPTSTRGLTLYVFSSCVLPGICEEFLFRGMILSAWERRGGRKAMLYSAALFMLLHGSVQGIPSQLLLGMVIAFLVTACDSIYAGMIYHTAHNAIVLLINFAMLRFNSISGEMLQESAAMQADISEMAMLALEFFYQFGLFAALMYLFKHRMTRRNVSLAQDTGVKTSAAELVVVLSGIVTTLVLYAEDILLMLGILS